MEGRVVELRGVEKNGERRRDGEVTIIINILIITIIIIIINDHNHHHHHDDDDDNDFEQIGREGARERPHTIVGERSQSSLPPGACTP